MRTPDTTHLAPEDAELVRALYLERWAALSPTELARVRAAATLDRSPKDPSRHAQHAA